MPVLVERMFVTCYNRYNKTALYGGFVHLCGISKQKNIQSRYAANKKHLEGDAMSNAPLFTNAAELEFFIELIEENRAAMTATAHSLLTKGFSGYVEDAVQEACVSIASNTFSIMKRLEHSKRRAFCVRVTRNKCIDIIRRNSKYKSESFDDVDFPIEAIDSDPLDKVLISENYNNIINAIDSLDENYSSVLKYKLIDGFDDAEIASILGISQKNVNVRTFRAKQKLRQILSLE
jgi:RNA polymerase sigma factor, sigma-70 family